MSEQFIVRGLQNLGNTCFFNAILQALASSRSFTKYLSKLVELAEGKEQDIPFTKALQYCLQELQAVTEYDADYSTVMPRDLNNELIHQHRSFRGNKQQDAQELLQFLADLVNEDYRICTNPKNAKKSHANIRHDEKSDAIKSDGLHTLLLMNTDLSTSRSILDMGFDNSLEEENWNPLYGLQVNILECTSCKSKRPLSNHKFLDVSLALTEFGSSNDAQNPITLESCIQRYTETEVVEGVECENCTYRGELDKKKKELEALKKSYRIPSAKAYDPDHAKNMQIKIKIHNLEQSVNLIMKYLSTQYLEDFTTTSVQSFWENYHDEDLTAHENDFEKKAPYLQKSHKRLQFSRTPHVFCFHLNRKVYNPVTGNLQKLENYVEFPLILDMSPYCTYQTRAAMAIATRNNDMKLPAVKNGNGWHAHNTHNGQNGYHLNGLNFSGLSYYSLSEVPQNYFQYELVSVITHKGTARSGHFTAYRRLPNRQWVFISDDVVKKVHETDVLRTCAYLLFYERSSKLEEDEEEEKYSRLENLPYETME